MIKNTKLYAMHIIEAIQLITEWTNACDSHSFTQDRMRYDAILRNLQTITESLQRFPQSIKDLHPEIPWRDISGFRNIVVHDYLDGIDKGILWTIITVELPVIHNFMTRHLQTL